MRNRTLLCHGFSVDNGFFGIRLDLNAVLELSKGDRQALGAKQV